MKPTAPLTVVICCHNSTQRLLTTLQHLAFQDAEPGTWEIVLVDNASIDGTAEAARDIWQKLASVVPFRVVREEQLGLSFARLRGVNEARYETVGFVDDDNWLESNWVSLASRTMEENPQIGLLGSGNIEPVFEHHVPDWLNNFAPMLACGVMPGETLQEVAQGGTVAGAGMITRKNVFWCMRDFYGNFQTTDRKGASTASGGDIEFSYIVSILGWKLAKHPNLRMKHFIPSGRTKPTYLNKLLVSTGQAANLLDPLRRFASASRSPSSSIVSYFRLLIASFLYGCQDLLRVIGSRHKRSYYRIIFSSRIAQITHLIKFYPEYHRAFSKAHRFVALLGHDQRAHQQLLRK